MQRKTLKWATTTAVTAALLTGFINPANAGAAAIRHAAQVADEVQAATGTFDVIPASQTGHDADSAAIAKTDGSTVDVPKDPSNDVIVTTPTGEQIGIGIANGAIARDAITTASGTTVYTDVATGTTTTVQATSDGGVRQTIVIPNAAAPREYTVPIFVPNGYGLRANANGSIDLENAQTGDVLGGFATPWAKDASGTAIPTSYRIDGNTLIQTVEFDADAAFPVVADPWWNPLSWINPFKDKVLRVVARYGFNVARIATVANMSCAIAIVNSAYNASRKKFGVGDAISLGSTCGVALLTWLAA
jgi:hypothetical protein